MSPQKAKKGGVAVSALQINDFPPEILLDKTGFVK
jgi:hypothetical protein